jgi:uncharacterized membrane protein (DUF4010 family)
MQRRRRNGAAFVRFEGESSRAMPLPIHVYDTFPPTEVSTRLALAVGVGMVIGFEREWSHKDFGTRTFAIASVFGMLCGLLGNPFGVVALLSVVIFSIVGNARRSAGGGAPENTTALALVTTTVLGVLIGQGHLFTPIASAIIITLLLSLKEQFRRMTGGVQPREIQSAVLLGLIGFVIYPTLPGRTVDPWHLLNPRQAWITVILVAGIGFVNYVLLRLYSQRGLIYSAILGGLVNSTATAAELATWIGLPGPEGVHMSVTVVLLTTLAMFVRNLLILAIFSPASAAKALAPLAAMIVTGAAVTWLQRQRASSEPGELVLDSPVSLRKVLRFGAIFVAIQIAGTLAERHLGNAGFLGVSLIGGLVSSASSAAAAAHLGATGQLTPELAAVGTVLASMTSALSSVPLVQRIVRRRDVTRALWGFTSLVVAAGVLAALLQHYVRI